MSGYSNTKQWRFDIKTKFINVLGGECANCGYKRCIHALEFHHIDPSKKESEISKMIVNGKINDKFFEEIKKCICLCSVCHKELHAGLIKCPPATINEELIKIEIEKRNPIIKTCKKCGGKTTKKGSLCKSCFNITKIKFDVSKDELKKLIKEMPITSIGKKFNVSDNAIRKRCKKMNIEIPKFPRGYWIKKGGSGSGNLT